MSVCLQTIFDVLVPVAAGQTVRLHKGCIYRFAETAYKWWITRRNGLQPCEKP